MIFNSFTKLCGLGIAVSNCAQTEDSPLKLNNIVTPTHSIQKNPTLIQKILMFICKTTHKIFTRMYAQDSIYNLVKIIIFFGICLMFLIFHYTISKIFNRIRKLLQMTGAFGILIFAILIFISVVFVIRKMISIFGTSGTITLISLVAVLYRFYAYIRKNVFYQKMPQIAK